MRPPLPLAWSGTTLTETQTSGIGFLALVTFLGINGLDFDATERDVVTAMLTPADGRMSEDQLVDWVRSHVTRSKRI